QHRAGVDIRQHAISTQHHGLDMHGGGQNSNDDIRPLGRLGHARRAASTEDNEHLHLGGVDIVYMEVKPLLLQIFRQWGAHGTEPDESNFGGHFASPSDH